MNDLVDLGLVEVINRNVDEYEFPSTLYSVKNQLEDAEKELYATEAYKKVLALKQQVADYEKNRKDFEKLLIEKIGAGGILETKTHFISVKHGKVSTAVNVDDIDLVPEEFVRITKEAKKTEAGKILRRDGVIPGLSLVENVGEPKLVIERKEMEIIHAE